MLASAEVGRALCVPSRHLRDDPDGRILRPGAVTVLIVPRSRDESPFPSPELLETVRSFLDGKRLLTADLCVLGPEYVRIDVTAEIAIESLDVGDLELAVLLELKRFLHPLRGGFDHTGWEFGRRLQPSELYKLIEPISGVKYVASLEITERPQRPGAPFTSTFLICSGEHKVRVFLPES